MAYETTEISCSKSQEKILQLLRLHGIEAVQFAENFNPPKMQVMFAYKTKEGGRVVKYEVNIKPINPSRRLPAPKQIEQSRRQAMRVLYYYFKSAFEAVEAGLLKKDDIFMPFFMMSDGKLLKESLGNLQGRLALLPN